MPVLAADAAAVINLYNLCKRSNTLPRCGGVLDQPAALMGLFQEIDAEIAKAQDEAENLRKMDAERGKLKEELRQRHRRR